MSDLSNLLGDLYGDSSSPDGPPVRREAPAAERTARADDDLAAALSAALAEPPAAPAPPVMAQVQAPAPAPMPDPAPVAPQVARGAWTAAPESRTESYAPATAPMGGQAMAGPRMWLVGDDDITPMSGGAKKRR